MKRLLKKLNDSVKHLESLHDVFSKSDNYELADQEFTYKIYKENDNELKKLLEELDMYSELYSERCRQMILSDLYEYILLGRGYYALKKQKDKQSFIATILRVVNLLMCYEAITVSNKLRRKVIEELGKKIPAIKQEEKYDDLINFIGNIGLPGTYADKVLGRYFDKILPKTAGGLWHELLVYIFLLRNNVGFIIPLLLTQRFIGYERNIVPPDFLILTHQKNIYGIEVGIKKEIQSGSFALQTNIPTATLDTINSRNSDRCPACLKWIQFCPHVINNYADFEKKIESIQVKCLDECSIYNKEEILAGKCKYAKYSRNRATTKVFTHHDFADGYHYHYCCVLEGVSEIMKNKIIEAEDSTAIKTHYPYYAGLEELIN